ncbi:hypothetical protein [Streptomyces anulatus]|uniref:Uncharacterized protein n=1 Tax=Streptomyces anulatus TaxID=1892 RepID=A0ABZ1ZPB1_STRAQ|nr:hypothetical protein [Streptomyces anulatus]
MSDANGSIVEGTLIHYPRWEAGISSCGDTARGMDETHAELHAMQKAYDALKSLDGERKGRVIKWLMESLAMDVSVRLGEEPEPSGPLAEQERSACAQAERREVSVRDFISQKKPQSLVERVACLGYYLTHYRDQPHFRAPDIVQLNTDAAAHKFGNPSRDIDNADRQNGYLVTAGSGLKQITPRGEAVVEALPDREAVKTALRSNPFKSRRANARKTAPKAKDES